MSLTLAGFGIRLRRLRMIVTPNRRARGWYWSPPYQASVQQRRQELGQFRDHYETLVEAMCEAAQYGPTPRLEQEYARGCTWLGARYPSLRPQVIAFLAPEKDTWAPANRTDDFAALFAARSLDEFLQADNGSMISRITRTREALVLYGEHLRLLAARSA